MTQTHSQSFSQGNKTLVYVCSCPAAAAAAVWVITQRQMLLREKQQTLMILFGYLVKQ
jgi:hypothetical protein